MATLRERVTKGAEFLDRVRPDWFLDIRLGILDLNSCHACVLGQLYSYYDQGLDRLGMPDNNDNEDDLAVAHGFCLRHGEAGTWTEFPNEEEREVGMDRYSELEGWLMLTACWEDAIRARRRAAQTVTSAI